MKKIFNITASLLFLISSGAIAVQNSKLDLNEKTSLNDIAYESFTRDAKTADAYGLYNKDSEETILSHEFYKSDPLYNHTLVIKSLDSTISRFEGSGIDYTEENPWLGDCEIKITEYKITEEIAFFELFQNSKLVGSASLILEIVSDTSGNIEFKLTAHTYSVVQTFWGWAKTYSTYGITYYIY